MLTRILFKLIDFWIYIRPRNWEVIEQGTYTDGTPYTIYIYNGNTYTHVGEFHVNTKSSFRIPVQSVNVDGEDKTALVKQYIGPFGNSIPDSGYIFYTKKPVFQFSFQDGGLRLKIFHQREKGPERTMVVKNIFGQSIDGAR